MSCAYHIYQFIDCRVFIMTAGSKAPASHPLADMDLRIGQPVQLILHGPQTYKHYTRLIGHVEHEFIMLRVPMENGWAVPLHEGQALEVRAFSGTWVYEFSSRVLTLLHHPRNYLLLSPPTNIRQSRLREHERVRCHLPVQIVQAPAGQAPWTGYRLDDLSAGGGALVGPAALGQAGERLELTLDFALAATQSQETLTLGAVIQSCEVSAPGQVRHGLRFEKIDARLVLLVHETGAQRPQA